MEKKTKECPFCWEEILETAKKCKHCGEFLDKEENNISDKEEFNFEEKIYKKDRTAKIVVILFWGLIAGFFFAFGSSVEWGGVCIFLWICCLIPILSIFCQRLVLEKDRIKIIKGIIFKNIKYIQYNKINDAELNTFSSTIILYTWNDKPIKFSWIEKPNEVLELIQKKINK